MNRFLIIFFFTIFTGSLNAHDLNNFSHETITTLYGEKRTAVNDSMAIVVKQTEPCCGHGDREIYEMLVEESKEIDELITNYEIEKSVVIPQISVTNGKHGEGSTCYRLTNLNIEMQKEIILKINEKSRVQKFSLAKKLNCSGIYFE